MGVIWLLVVGIRWSISGPDNENPKKRSYTMQKDQEARLQPSITRGLFRCRLFYLEEIKGALDKAPTMFGDLHLAGYSLQLLTI